MPRSGTRPVELCSIINVVQHDPAKEQDVRSRKMELKSVVCLGNRNTQGSNAAEVKRHDPKSQKVSDASTEKPILLLPFGHQVSGRANIMCFNETTLLKPYVSRELFFYQTIPQDLKRFTPQFRGVVMVSFIEDSTTSSVLAYALPRTLVKPNTKNIFKLIGEEPKPHSKRCVKDYGKTHVIYPSDELSTDELTENLFVESGEDFNPVVTSVTKTTDMDDEMVSELSQGFDMQVCIDDKKPSGKENENFSTSGLHNPWNSKVLDDAWLKLKDSDAENPSNLKKKRFTLLENVVARYRRPCVLDLKIGTRVRENASEEKIARHVTAINIGARLSGMQIYHPEQENFKYHNKYYGHNLTITGFKSNLRHFFSRGRIPIKGSSKQSDSDKKTSSLIDRKLVEEAIKKLTELKETIQSIQSHRFYSSSVLLLYDGDVSSVKETKPDICDEDDEKFQTDHCDHELKNDSSSEKKISTRSFSFTDFLQRLKHAKRIHENPSHIHDDLSHDSRKHHASQKFMKGSVIYKAEKNRSKSAHKSHKLDHDSKHHHDLDSDIHESQFRTKSWPPRSKITKRPHSVVIPCDHDSHEYLSRRHSHRDDHSKDRNSRKHHREHELQKIYGSKKHFHGKEQKSSNHGENKKNNDSQDSPLKSDGDHEKLRKSKHSQKQTHESSKSRKSHHESSKSLKNKHDEIDDSQKSHDEYHKSPDDDHDQKTEKCSKREDLKRRHCDLPNHHDNLEVKMIDFAHYCFHDDTMHPGPDGGFLFGLENLIKLFSEMLKQS